MYARPGFITRPSDGLADDIRKKKGHAPTTQTPLSDCQCVAKKVRTIDSLCFRLTKMQPPSHRPAITKLSNNVQSTCKVQVYLFPKKEKRRPALLSICRLISGLSRALYSPLKVKGNIFKEGPKRTTEVSRGSRKAATAAPNPRFGCRKKSETGRGGYI